MHPHLLLELYIQDERRKGGVERYVEGRMQCRLRQYPLLLPHRFGAIPAEWHSISLHPGRGVKKIRSRGKDSLCRLGKTNTAKCQSRPSLANETASAVGQAATARHRQLKIDGSSLRARSRRFNVISAEGHVNISHGLSGWRLAEQMPKTGRENRLFFLANLRLANHSRRQPWNHSVGTR
jgi:hypothetical protein